MQPQQQRKPARAEVLIDGRAVMQATHDKYAALIGQLMAENANLQVGFETAQAEIAQKNAQIEALRAQLGVVNVAAPPSAGPAAAAR